MVGLLLILSCIHPAGPSGSDPIAMMEYYMKKAAQEEKLRALRSSKDEMPPPASLHEPQFQKEGSSYGRLYPTSEELAKFLSTCNDAVARKAAIEAAERSLLLSVEEACCLGLICSALAEAHPYPILFIQVHKCTVVKRFGEGLGSSKSGIADPISAGTKSNNLGVGAHQPGGGHPEDDIYEQYKKRMMLGYKYRPNPLNNPRKAYY
ncbi:hypothetical protein HAX54_029714 [Datura stramonium]|uniref:G-patch domain-containing protein n=1 Tax=Datura stramonium TaxID=4076 RepID=A0ABS8RLJ1_DATST|nr:hypothetical protein [Datura stramonium]